MGTVTTIYDIQTRYSMQDHVSGGARRMAENFRAARVESNALQSSFGRVAGMVGAYVGIHQAKKVLLDYNSTMEQSQIQMAGLMAQAGSGDFTGNLGQAALLMRQMRDDAAKTVGTTQDYVAMASQLIQPLTMAGAKLQDIREMTRLSVVGSRAMGIDAIVSARDIDQAIRGQYRQVDQFSGKLLTPLGYGGEEGRRKFNAMSMQKRFSELQRSLKSPAIEAMARAQESTFEGVTSTAQSLFSETMGRVGMPIFKGITKELAEWNTWLQANEGKVQQMAEKWGGDLLTAAKAFGKAIAFAAEHWRVLAGAYGISRLVDVLNASAAASKAAAAAAATAQAGGVAGAAGGVGLGGKLAVGTIVATAVYVGATELANYIDANQTESLRRRAVAGPDVIDAAMAAVARYRQSKSDDDRGQQARVFAQLAKSTGMSESQLREAMASRLDAGGGANRAEWERAAGLDPRKLGGGMSSNWEGSSMHYDSATIANALAKGFAGMFEIASRKAFNMMDELSTPWRMPGLTDAPKGTGKRGDTKITINRIEVISDDPDRFAFGMEEMVNVAVRNGNLTPQDVQGALSRG